jgi:hypothetical protein
VKETLRLRWGAHCYLGCSVLPAAGCNNRCVRPLNGKDIVNYMKQHLSVCDLYTDTAHLQLPTAPAALKHTPFECDPCPQGCCCCN